MLCQLLNRDTVDFIHLQALDKEQARLDVDGLVHSRELVATIVDLCDQVFHLVTVERCDTDHHFVQHDTHCPRIDLLVIVTLLEELRTRVKWCATDTQTRVRPIQDCG